MQSLKYIRDLSMNIMFDNCKFTDNIKLFCFLYFNPFKYSLLHLNRIDLGSHFQIKYFEFVYHLKK